MINIIFLNLIIYYSIYNLNSNSNLVKLINLSKLFTNVYKSLLSFIFFIIIINQYLYLKYFLFYLLSIQVFLFYLFIYYLILNLYKHSILKFHLVIYNLFFIMN